MSGQIAFPDVSDPVASVVVIGWRNAPYLLSCLATLAATAPRVPYEVLVALNEPNEALVDVLAEEASGVNVVVSADNLGFGGILNRAVNMARGRYAVFLNDDTEVLEGWLDGLVDVADRRAAGAVGSRLLEPDGTVQESGGIIWQDGWTWSVGRGLPADSSRFDYERMVDYCSASSLLVRRSLFEQLGGFDPSYYPAYFEDADLCLRLVGSGSSVWFAPRSNVRHFESASTGGRYRQFLMARNHEHFAALWRAELEDKEPRVAANEPAVDRAVWRAMGSPCRVLVIDDRTPDPSVGSGFPRMAQILARLQADPGLQLSLYTTVHDGAKDRDGLSRLGIGVIDEPLETHLQRIGRPYECVVISRPHNYEHLAPLVRRMSTAPIVYDAEALYSRRIALQASLVTESVAQAALAEAAEEMRAVESAIAANADCVVCLSEDEAQFFRDNGSGPVVVFPPVLEGIDVTAAGFSERTGIGFVAGWLGGEDSPNAHALIWFVTEVLPIVCEQLPDLCLFVTGANPPATVTGLGSDHLQFVGSLTDLADIYERVKVVVSPMLYGAGVKNKTVEALQYGVPTVATSVGAEGIRLIDPDVLIVSDDPSAMAARLVELLSDESAWRRQRDRVRAEVGIWSETFDPTQWVQIVRRMVTGDAAADERKRHIAAPATAPTNTFPIGRAVAVSPIDVAHQVQADYIAFLEAELAASEEAYDVASELRRVAEEHEASLGHLVQQMRAQPSYRLAQRLALAARKCGLLRRLGRAARARFPTKS